MRRDPARPPQRHWHSAARRKRYSRKRRIVGEAGGLGEGRQGGLLSAEPLQQMSPCGPVGLVTDDPFVGDGVEGREAFGKAVRLGECDRSTDFRTDPRGDLQEPLIQQDDLRPVRGTADGPLGVDRLDRRFELVATDPVLRRGGPEMGFRFVDHRSLPARSVLLIEGDEFSIRRVAGFAAGFAVEHEGEESPPLRFAGHQLDECPSESDRFRREAVEG